MNKIAKIYYDLLNLELTEEQIKKYMKKIDINEILLFQKVSEEFIEENIDKIDFEKITNYQNFSKEFINKYADKVYWPDLIEFNKNVDEEIITKNIEYTKEYFDFYVPLYVKLSKEFIEKNIEYLNINELIVGQKHIEIEYFEKFFDTYKIDFNYIIRNREVDEDFIKKYIDKIDKNVLKLCDYLSEESKKEFNIEIKKPQERIKKSKEEILEVLEKNYKIVDNKIYDYTFMIDYDIKNNDIIKKDNIIVSNIYTIYQYSSFFDNIKNIRYYFVEIDIDDIINIDDKIINDKNIIFCNKVKIVKEIDFSEIKRKFAVISAKKDILVTGINNIYKIYKARREK